MMQTLNHQIIRDRGGALFSDPAVLPKNEAQELYRLMVRLRKIEEAIIKEYRVAEEIRCPVHFTIGQEAVSSALTLFLRPEDHLYCHHRSHGYYFAKKCPLKGMLSELFGRENGANGGLAGSQEISYPSMNFNSGAILAGASSIAVGSAMAFKLNKTDQVAVAGFGEAATEEGIFWESISFASTNKLPLIYLCENNIYSMYSHQLKRQPGDNIHDRVAQFGVKTQVKFGNDVVAAYQSIEKAVQEARSGEGPQFIEFYTYRWSAHVGPEPDDSVQYRQPEEQEFWRRLCPIEHYRKNLVALGWWDDESDQRINAEIQQEIDEAFTHARSSAFPKTFLEKNLSASSPVAEKLLPISSMESLFDAHQLEARLAPY